MEDYEAEMKRQRRRIQARLRKLDPQDEAECHRLIEEVAETVAKVFMGDKFDYFAGGSLSIVYSNMGLSHQHVRDDFRRRIEGRELATAVWPKSSESERPEDAHNTWAVLVDSGDGERWLEVACACYVADAKPPVELHDGEVEGHTNLIQSRLERMSVRDAEGCYALAEYTARTAATSLMGVRFGFIEGGVLCIVYANMGSRNQHVLDEFRRQLDWKELATATWPKLIDCERPEDAHHSWAVVINDCDGEKWRDAAAGRNPEAE